MTMDSNCFAKLMELESPFLTWIVISLYERLREEGLSQEEAMKVVKEEVEIQAMEAKGMTRSDAQGVMELNDPNHPSNKGRKNT